MGAQTLDKVIRKIAKPWLKDLEDSCKDCGITLDCECDPCKVKQVITSIRKEIGECS